MAERHELICQCIKRVLEGGLGSGYEDIQIRDYDEDVPLEIGITISPIGEEEQIGTNERDDIDYSTLVTRKTHAMGNDDLIVKSNFRDEVRRLFHHKRINCGDGCYMHTRVSFGQFSVPSAWKSDNNSVTACKIMMLVRESRT
jgi:hypothetical protein